MDRLLKMDKQQFVSQMQAEIRGILERVADAVNNAPQGNVINGSEVQVRDLMAELRQKVFQTAVQMRIDATEASFSPSEGCPRQAQAE
jgi:acyl transferase domain-containing protein